jgi:sporulation protein YlmC with PRC-barrel domain
VIFLVSAEVLRGKKVIGVRGIMIGQVDGVEISVDNWKATHLRVQLTDEVAKQLGFRRGFLASNLSMSKPVISLPVEAIEHVGDVVTVKSEIKELKDLEDAGMKVTGASPVPA